MRCTATELLPASGIRHIPLLGDVVPQAAQLQQLPSACVLAWEEPRAGDVATSSAELECLPMTSVS